MLSLSFILILCEKYSKDLGINSCIRNIHKFAGKGKTESTMNSVYPIVIFCQMILILINKNT